MDRRRADQGVIDCINMQRDEAIQLKSSCPGSTRASIELREESWLGMDGRVKPGHDKLRETGI